MPACSGPERKLLRWIDASTAKRVLELTRFDIVEDWIPGFHWFQARMRVGGKTYLGVGKARLPLHAAFAAVAESVEAYLLQAVGEPGETSSGLAVHTSLRQAKKNAMLELVERDAYLCHHLTRTPFFPVPAPLLDRNSVFPTYRSRLRKVGIEVQLREIPISGGISVIICGAFGDEFVTPFGAVLGMGCSDDVSAAINGAVCETWARLAPLLYGAKPQRASMGSIRALPRIEQKHHEQFSLSVYGAQLLRELFARPTAPSSPLSRPRGFVFQKWERLPSPLSNCPLVAVRAQNPALQTLFFGLPTPALINKKRLEGFLKQRRLRPRGIEMERLHLLP